MYTTYKIKMNYFIKQVFL